MFVTYLPNKRDIRLQQQLRQLAHEMRLHPTAAEAKMWKIIKQSELDGLHFRRQHPIFCYIVDFYCHRFRLVVEIDGPIHNHQLPQDKSRDDFLKTLGYTTLRFTNAMVMSQPTDVLQKIINHIRQISSPGGEG